MKKIDLLLLKLMAVRIRKWVVLMIFKAGSGHPGSSLSEVEIMVYLWFYAMIHDKETFEKGVINQDLFHLSKGHGCPAWYAIQLETGYLEWKHFLTLRQLDSPFQGHPSREHNKYVRVNSGSLGQGLSVVNGMAFSLYLDNLPYRVFGILGDGECDEGQIWEAAMSASHFKKRGRYGQVLVFIDRNSYQLDGATEEIMEKEPFSDKWESFGWFTQTIDGHDFEEIDGAVKRAQTQDKKPPVIIAETIKGKGVSFMEEEPGEWHGQAPKFNQTKVAITELNQEEKRLIREITPLLSKTSVSVIPRYLVPLFLFLSKKIQKSRV